MKEVTELDRLLAEKIMGWHAHDNQYFIDLGDCPDGRRYETAGYYIYPKQPEHFELNPQTWHPTSSIEQAMMVWNVMLAKTEWLMNCLRFVGEPNGDWCIDGPIVCVYADTPAMAISLAAKAWLDARVGK